MTILNTDVISSNKNNNTLVSLNRKRIKGGMSNAFDKKREIFTIRKQNNDDCWGGFKRKKKTLACLTGNKKILIKRKKNSDYKTGKVYILEKK